MAQITNRTKKWDKYHKVSGLEVDALKGTQLKSLLLNCRKKTKFLRKTVDRLLGIPSLPENVSRVLDIGGGSGYTLIVLTQLYENIETYSVDICKVDNLPDFIKFFQLDIEKTTLPFQDNFFDFIICRGVLEHLHEVTYLFDEAYRVLRPGGTFHILTENYTSLFLPSTLITAHTINFWDDYTHIRPYTKKSLKRLLERSNFVDIKVKTNRNLLILFAFPLLLFLQLTRKFDVGRLLFEVFAPDLSAEAKKQMKNGSDQQNQDM